jgi:hypothetical protein
MSSPACTELEVVMLDWLGKMLDLPADFLACSGGKGGGVIQSTASEATLVALLGAKAKALKAAREANPDTPEALLTSKLVGYCSGWYTFSFLLGELQMKVKFSTLFLEYKICLISIRSSSLFRGTRRTFGWCDPAHSGGWP